MIKRGCFYILWIGSASEIARQPHNTHYVKFFEVQNKSSF
jgi:hypothetical protein